jgi:CRP/FNR family cyclic AMP-dependent transcriptional regulator
MPADPADKKIFLVVGSDAQRNEALAELIRKNVTLATVYAAHDGPTALDKAANVPPHVIVADFDVAKMAGPRFVDAVMSNSKLPSTALVITANPPEKEQYLDEIVTGKLQFLGDANDESLLVNGLYRALDFAFHGDQAEFNLRFLAAGDQLIREGSKADFVYFVKNGTLRAFRQADGRQIELGIIGVGEFVGEMSYINGEPRMASVDAVTGCELIEVPIGIFDVILFRRPAWSKALMLCLSRRLKQANADRI